MAYQISDVATIVQNSIGDRGGVVARDDLVLYWVNEAILDIYRKTALGRTANNTFALAVGENTYDPTVDNNEILRVHYMHNTEFEMEEVTFDQILNRFGPAWQDINGTPQYWFRGWNSGHVTIKTVPKADKAYTINYSATFTPVRFTLMTEYLTARLPESYHDDVILFCKMRAHELEKDFRASEKAQEHYDKNMLTRADESFELDDGYSTVTPDEMDFV